MYSRVTSFLAVALFTAFCVVISIASAADASENPALRSEAEKNVNANINLVCTQVSGDLTGNNSVGLNDLSALINYVENGVVPANPTAGDVDGDCDIDEDDIAYLTDYFFGVPIGPAPVPCVCNDPVLIPSTPCTQLSGDLDGNSSVGLSDLSALFSYVENGVVPANPTAGDVDGDCDIDDDDFAYLQDFLFGIPSGPAPVPCACNNPVLVTTCCKGIMRGNANNDPDDKANVSDVSYLVEWLFGIPQGPEPICIEEANANGDLDEKANVSDISYLTTWLFGIPQGPEPPACP